MIRGRTTIQLTDVNTGKVTETVSENMMTSSLEKIFNAPAFSDPRLVGGVLQSWFGGIMCFQNEQPEDKTHLFPASDNRIVAHAGYSVNTGNNVFLGSINAAESDFTTQGQIKLVWDWSTNQGNGTISSLSLTTDTGGKEAPVSFDTNTRVLPFGIGSIFQAGDIFFGNHGCATVESVSVDSITLQEYEFAGDLVTLSTILRAKKKATTTVIPFPAEFSATLTAPPTWKRQRGDSNSILIGAQNYVYQNESAKWVRLKEDLTFEVIDFVNITERAFRVTDAFVTPKYICNGTEAIVRGTTEFVLQPVGYEILASYNGWLYGNQAAMSIETGQSSRFNHTYSTIDDTSVTSTGDSFYLATSVFIPFTLHTINNITPVTKTDAQTMKIIYTLTDE